MNCASRTDMTRRRSLQFVCRSPVATRPRGVTLLELLVAIVIVMVFLAGAYITVAKISEANAVANARQEAMSNARHALETLSLEVKRARYGPVSATPRDLFEGECTTQTTITGGNRIDDNHNGLIDEEYIDGHSQGYWTSTDDLHAVIAPANTVTSITLYERFQGLGRPDLDDLSIDNDNWFSSSTLSFRTFPDLFNPTPGIREVSFFVTRYDGEDRVLVRTVTTAKGTAAEQTTTSPLAFNVLSFGSLYWNANTYPKDWVTSWSAESVGAGEVKLPSTVFFEVTCYAGTQPLASLGPNQRIPFATLTTAVNIESVLADPLYVIRRNVYH